MTIERREPSPARKMPLLWQMALAVAVILALYFLSTIGQTSPAMESVQKGQMLARAGRMAEAEAQWKQAVAQDPNCAEAWTELGNYYRSVGDFDAAIEPYRRLAALKPDTPGVFGYLGGSVAQARNPEPAYEQALQVLTKNPNDIAALTIASTYLTSRDEQRMQLTYLRKLTQLLPKDPMFLTTLAKTLVNTHHYDEAGPVLERLVALAPDNPAAYDLRGQYLLKGVGSPQALTQAESDFLKTLQLNTRSNFPHLNLGRVYLRLGQPDKALEQLQLAAQLMPNRPDVYFEMASAYRLAKQPGLAAQMQAKFLALRHIDDRANTLVKRANAFPDDFEIHLELARLQVQLGEMDKAQETVAHALALRPNSAEAKALANQLTAMMSGPEGRP